LNIVKKNKGSIRTKEEEEGKAHEEIIERVIS